MLPIYNELLKFWRDLGQEVDIQEGYYWLEKGFIKAFDKSGELHKLYKYKVNDDLSILITKHEQYNSFISAPLNIFLILDHNFWYQCKFVTG